MMKQRMTVFPKQKKKKKYSIGFSSQLAPSKRIPSRSKLFDRITRKTVLVEIKKKIKNREFSMRFLEKILYVFTVMCN